VRTRRPFIIDSHEDIGWHLAKHNRPFFQPVHDGQSMVTYEKLVEGRVVLSIATLFAEHDAGKDVRRERLHRQLEMYRNLPHAGCGSVRQVLNRAQLKDLMAAYGRGEEAWGFVLMLEGADLLQSPDELDELYASGLRLLSLTWNEDNQWAAGAKHRKGLKPAGRELLRKMRELGMVLDVSHLNHQSFADAMEAWEGPVCATHSNPAAVCAGFRNLLDEELAELRRREAVVGVLLYNMFLEDGWRDGQRQTPLSKVGEHILYLLDKLGEDSVGIGSDLDGGLTPKNTPEGVNTVADLRLIEEELARRDVAEDTIRKVMGENWFRFLQWHLPAGASPPP